MGWERPSEPVRELIRRGAELSLAAPRESFDEVDEAVLKAPNMGPVAADPVLREGIRRTNRANMLHWAAANVRDPGVAVAANLGEEPLTVARDLVRRGLNESMLDAYRVGQEVAWRQWMAIAFELTSDAGELRELLEVSSRSISAFVDATVSAVGEQMRAERAELTQGTHAERRAMVALLLDGAPIARAHAESILGYRFEGVHTAAVVWSDAPDSDAGQLDSVAEGLARSAGAMRRLSVVAGSATRWVWVPGSPDADAAAAAVDALPGVRVALGAPEHGLEGFRRSHFDALTTQRMLARIESSRRIATYREVAVVALITEDLDGADRFVRQTLGDLATAAPEVRAVVSAFVEEQCNAVRAAQRLFTHRNTVLRRLAQADRLLPRPLRDNSIDVAVALDVVRWRGARA
ncbi:PucR family transcriptional regulator [Nocardia sp. NPDC059764]|uniref:PucR family transcriptional regulator n=1 Tax=Nocardia sp. NPDC059764 TaxID=3346939 RepID=UPI003660C514